MTPLESLREMSRTTRTMNHNAEILRNPDQLAHRINITLANEGWLPEIIGRRFDTEGASSGNPWPALKPETIRQRGRQGFGPGPLLTRTGTLRAAVTVQARQVASPGGIRLSMKDGKGPVYVGGGKAIGRGKLRGHSTWGSPKLSEYAGALDRERPFFGPPVGEEARPVYERRSQLVQQAIVAVFQNRPILGAFGG